MPNKTILVVDDEEDHIRRPLLRQLRRAFSSYEFIEAGDGIEALKQIDEHEPTLVILDLMMPNLDGLSVLKELKKRRLLGRVKVLVFSAANEEGKRIEALKLGALDYLNKNADMEERNARIRNLLAIKTPEEALLGGYVMMARVLAAVISLVRAPIAKLTKLAENWTDGLDMITGLTELLRLLTDFKEYLEFQGTSFTRSPVAICPLLSQAIINCPGQLRQSKEGPRYLCKDSVMVPGDEKMLNTVLMTILGNAAQHALPETPVQISIAYQDANVEITVENRHAGISRERQKRLFDPFVIPAHGAGRGFGLDLAIAQVIAQKHGGKITCTSEPNGLTTFVLKLPASENKA